MLCEVVGHDLIELTLCNVAKLEMFDFYPFTGVPHLIDLRFHLIEIAFQPLFTLLVREVNLFQTSRKHLLLLLLCQVGLR